MADASINGLPVIQCRLQRPRMGNWVAELSVDIASNALLPAGSSATLSLYNGLQSYVGTMIRVDTWVQSVSLRLIGGSNKLGALASPRYYEGAALSVILQQLLVDSNETLSPLIASSILNFNFPVWCQIAQPISAAFTSLAQAIDSTCIWRIQPDGTVFFGIDGFPVSALTDYQLTTYRALEYMQEIATENPSIHPGENFAGKNVSMVEHLIHEKGSRVRILFE